MIVVADTSPINYLVILGHIEILPKIYGEILIPQAVLDELQDSDALKFAGVLFATYRSRR